jgi:alpha-L-fucosidase 2
MQSYDETIRLFPNWPVDKDAEFQNLRAVGAFLVSASLKNGQTEKIEIFSEAGGLLKIILPWKSVGSITSGSGQKMLQSNVVEIQTKKGETIVFRP